MPVLQFKGKTAVENYHHTVPHHVLEIDRKLSLSKKPSLDDNLIIEGDNLLALKSLLPTHAGRVKCIYIDPPYNTGNERWVYNDNLTQPQFKEWIGREVGKEGEDATRHDKWCCMMYPRLQLLKELLRDDGVIFVSIDDIEVANLRQMMDEVFGSENLIACLVWKARIQSDARSTTGVSIDHEYILAYGRSVNCRLRGGERDESKYSNPDRDARGPWMSNNILGLASKERRPNLHYVITDPASSRKFSPPKESGWRYEPDTMNAKITENRIIFPRTSSGRPREKIYLSEMKSRFAGFPSIINEVHTSDGTRELRDIFGTDVFLFPKPSKLLRILVQQATDAEDIILDSLAGSGTTGHGVLALNKEDGSHRKFILVQQPYDTKENERKKFNICEKITSERVRRVIEGYCHKDNAGKRHKVPGLGGEFTYARVGKVLLDEHRGFSRGLPAYEDLARYIFYTDTSQTLDPSRIDKKSGLIGEHDGTSYYLLYTPNGKEDRCLDRAFLKSLKDKSPRKVVYCEKIWLHPDELREFGDVRAMRLPFDLK